MQTKSNKKYTVVLKGTKPPKPKYTVILKKPIGRVNPNKLA